MSRHILGAGEILIEIGYGKATAGGIYKEVDVTRLLHKGYLSTSGFERLVMQVYDKADEFMRRRLHGQSQPPYVIINAPPGVGKTFTMLRLLESVRRSGGVFGVQAPMAIYLAPFKSILEDVVNAYKRVVDGYDPARGKLEPVYLLYRSPRDCPFAQRHRELVEKWGSHEIVCKICAYKAKLQIGTDSRKLFSLMKRVVVYEGRGLGAPVVDVLPRREGDVCLRNLAVQIAMLLPMIKSKRSGRIAGLLGSFNSVLNPSYARLWSKLRQSDSPKLLIYDEFDMLVTQPVVINDDIPLDLYPSEKEVLGKTIGLDTYKRVLSELLELVENPVAYYLQKKREIIKILEPVANGPIDEVCRLCARKVLDEQEYCRLCNALKTLSFIAWFIVRAVENECSPVYEDAFYLSRPECFDYGLILSAEHKDDYIHVTARPVWWIARLLLDPFYPAPSTKVLASATGEIIYANPLDNSIFAQTLSSKVYGHAVIVDVKAKYDKLVVRKHKPCDNIYAIIASDALNPFLAFLGLSRFTESEGRELAIIKQATTSTCILLGDLVEVVGGRGSGLVFANSKRNAVLVAALVAEYMKLRSCAPITGRSEDYIRVACGGLEIYVTWYRSRISRGVSQFKDAKAAGVILWQSDPPTETHHLHHEFRQYAATVQSLFRIVRSLRPGLRYFIMFDFVWEVLRDRGPRWLREAPYAVETVDQNSLYSTPAAKICIENIEAFRNVLENAFKQLSS